MADPPLFSSQDMRKHVMMTLLDTEQSYVESLRSLIQVTHNYRLSLQHTVHLRYSYLSGLITRTNIAQKQTQHRLLRM